MSRFSYSDINHTTDRMFKYLLKNGIDVPSEHQNNIKNMMTSAVATREKKIISLRTQLNKFTAKYSGKIKLLSTTQESVHQSVLHAFEKIKGHKVTKDNAPTLSRWIFGEMVTTKPKLSLKHLFKSIISRFKLSDDYMYTNEQKHLHLLRNRQKYTIQDVLKHVDVNAPVYDKKIVKFDGDAIKMGSDRYKCFVKTGTKCPTCKTEGTYFYKERQSVSHKYHFNLYGINSNGEEVLFNKDHIVPRAKGGKNHISNYQTMCAKCNFDKADKII